LPHRYAFLFGDEVNDIPANFAATRAKPAISRYTNYEFCGVGAIMKRARAIQLLALLAK
jgi:hypothetical protein